MTTATWDGWAKVKTLLTSAGAALSTPIALVDRGIPTSVPAPMIRFWYDGNTSSPFGADTLGTSQEGIQLTVGVFLPMSGGTIEAEGTLDEYLEECDAAIQGVLLGDAYLGDPADDSNSAIGIRIEDTRADVVPWSGQLVRWVEIPIVYGLADRHPIST